MSGPAHNAASAGSGHAAIFKPPAAPVINHLLRSASWARERLKPFAGKTLRLNFAPFAALFAISAQGEVEDSIPAGAPDAELTVTPGIALRLLAGETDAWPEIDVSGDTKLAREILEIARNLRWDVEEDLSRVFGDIVAHRLTQAGEAFWRWQREAAGSFARAAAVYWTEEQPLIASRAEIERFNREVDALRDDVAQAEKRIGQLMPRGERR